MQADIRYPRLLVLFLAIGSFAIGMSEFATMSLSLNIQSYLQISETQMGHVISTYALGVFIGAPLLILCFAKLPRRSTLFILIIMYAIGHVFSLMATSYHAMLFARFLSGLPHGAFFGTAALFAGGIVAENKRGKMVAGVFLGLSAATVIGSPMAKTLAPIVGWKMLFVFIILCALITASGILLLIPKNYRQEKSNPMNELSALKNPHIWITLLTSAIGFGGLFAIYSYLADLLDKVTLMPFDLQSWVFFVFGCGIFFGNWVTGLAADKSVKWTVYTIILIFFCFSITFPLVVHHQLLIFIWIFVIGMSAGFGTVIQVRLMDVAGKAQLLSAALNHSAFNMANALGPLLAGMMISIGYSFEVSGYVSAALAFCGFILWTVAMILPKYFPIPKNDSIH